MSTTPATGTWNPFNSQFYTRKNWGASPPQVPPTETIPDNFNGKEATESIEQATEQMGTISQKIYKKYIKPALKSIKAAFKNIKNFFTLNSAEKIEEALQKQIAKADIYKARMDHAAKAQKARNLNNASKQALYKEFIKAETKQQVLAASYSSLKTKYAQKAGEEAAGKLPQSKILETLLEKAAKTAAKAL